jgi:hypothetical protein
MFTTAPFNGTPGVAPTSLGKPTPTFPGAIAGDAQLAIAVDRFQTALASPLDTVSTSMTVQNAAGIANWMLLSIDSEIVQVTGPAVGNTVPIRRGFDGTAPAIHLTSAAVSGFIDAYHHNTLVAEVEAIESALGANLSRIPGTQFLVSSTYNFTPQAPGGPLAVGTNQIFLNPMPAGLANGNLLYISGGTGAAESAPVTGVGTNYVYVTCANTHTGAWTIQSATAGIREAIVANPGFIRLRIPPGTYQIDGLVIDKLIWLEGSGENVTILQSLTGKTPALVTVNAQGQTSSDAPGQVNNTSIRISDFTVDLDNGSVAGKTLIGMQIDYVNRGRFDHLRFKGGSYGIKAGSSQQVAWSHFSDITILHPSNTAFWVGDTSMENWYDDIDIQQDSINAMQCGFQISRTTATDTGQNYMKRVRITRMNTGALTNGFLFTSTAANTVFNVMMVDCVADAITGDALKLVNCCEVKASLCWFASTGGDSVGSAINFNGGFNFFFSGCKLGSANASITIYSNAPANILFIRSILLEAGAGKWVYELPASGGPVGLAFGYVCGLFNIAAFTNDWGRMQTAQAGLLPMSTPMFVAAGNYECIYLYDGVANKYARIYFGVGKAGFLNDAHAHMLDLDMTSGALTIAGTLVANLPTANPGPGGGLYRDPATFAVYQGH